MKDYYISIFINYTILLSIQDTCILKYINYTILLDMQDTCILKYIILRILTEVNSIKYCEALKMEKASNCTAS